MHYYAPDSNSKDESGVRREPKKGSGKDGFEPDTIQRLAKMTKDPVISELIKEGKADVKIGFNVREDADGVAMKKEQAILKSFRDAGFYYVLPGRNLEGVSSTHIRNVLSGKQPITDVSYMPKSVLNFILEHSRYRGLITDLPQAIDLIARKLNGEEVDSTSFEEALGKFKHWMKIEEEHNSRTVEPHDFHEMMLKDINVEKDSKKPPRFVSEENLAKVYKIAFDA